MGDHACLKIVISATMNPPMAPTANKGPTYNIDASGAHAFRNRLQVQAAVATVQISRMPVLLTDPDTVIRSPITKPSVSNADGFNAGFDVRNSATKSPPSSPQLLHYDACPDKCHSQVIKGTDSTVPFLSSI